MDNVPVCMATLLNVMVAALLGTATESLPQGDRSPSSTVPGTQRLFGWSRRAGRGATGPGDERA